MAVFRSIVQPFAGKVLDRQTEFALCGPVRAQLIRDHPPGAHALLAQKAGQETLGGLGIAPFL
ncbi:hypothetical protein AA106555_1813 [Neokomagataea thailandica NBRC 106555]|uniref:Uncharacterized protein n=1 Tax=Neokomagataea thailandica NBRC 106555 TaxID=1223520 RepID=A0ABQ0QS10_9PROT|nr:hypothetical protein AA106555_1813 [Neokomagataea thailandica NBRC 106555]